MNADSMKDGRKPIPFLDLITPHEELKRDFRQVFESALSTASFVGGEMVDEFEQAFARFCDVEHCVGVASGTDALRFALMAVGVRHGDTVVTVPNTFIATAEAISQAGGTPNFVDVDERTYNMDPAKLEAYLEIECYRDERSAKLLKRDTGRPVTAVVPVHLYGQMADMDRILDLAERYRLLVVEDACQAHGALYFSNRERVWKKAGSLGKAAAFSFYPGKNLGACGEAGAITTNNEEVAAKIRMLRDHGQSRKYYHEIEGYNGRLDAIQAGFLRVKLKHLGLWNEQRRACARRYDELFASRAAEVMIPHEPGSAKSVYHLYVLRSEKRDELQRHLAEANIGTAIHYPVPLHLQNAYRELGYRAGDFPVSERAARQVLSLPMYPSLEAESQVVVAQTVEQFWQHAADIAVPAPRRV